MINSSMPSKQDIIYASPVKKPAKHSQLYTDTFNGKPPWFIVFTQAIEFSNLKEASTAMNSQIKSAQKPTRNFAKGGAAIGTNQATGGFVTNSHNICQYEDSEDNLNFDTSNIQMTPFKSQRGNHQKNKSVGGCQRVKWQKTTRQEAVKGVYHFHEEIQEMRAYLDLAHHLHNPSNEVMVPIDNTINRHNEIQGTLEEFKERQNRY